MREEPILLSDQGSNAELFFLKCLTSTLRIQAYMSWLGVRNRTHNVLVGVILIGFLLGEEPVLFFFFQTHSSDKSSLFNWYSFSVHSSINSVKSFQGHLWGFGMLLYFCLLMYLLRWSLSSMSSHVFCISRSLEKRVAPQQLPRSWFKLFFLLLETFLKSSSRRSLSSDCETRHKYSLIVQAILLSSSKPIRMNWSFINYFH
jgi:hypothetical protein